MTSQHRMILDHLETGESLTVAEALTRYGIYALSQRVGELKKAGYNIDSKPVMRNGKRFAEYRMGE